MMEGRQSSCKTVETCKGRFGRWKGDDLARQWELARVDSDNGREMILQDGGNLQGPTRTMEGRSCKTVARTWKEDDLARQWELTRPQGTSLCSVLQHVTRASGPCKP